MSAPRSMFLPGPFVLFCAGLAVHFLALVAPAHAGIVGTGTTPRVVAVGDLNGDGYADLVSGNGGDSCVVVSLGLGSGRFKRKVQYSCGSSVYGIAVADLNNDGHPDVVSCCPNIGKLGVRFGVGDGTLGPRTDYTINSPMGVAVGDVNEDGLPDLAIASTFFPYMTVMIATGPGTYGPQTTYPGTSGTGVGIGDMNHDGHLDVVTATSSGFNVYLSTGSPGTYAAPVNYPLDGPAAGVILVDLNHDNRLDMVAPIPSANEVDWRVNQGSGTFYPTSSFATGTSPSGVAAGDFNGDTHVDLAVTNNAANTVSVFIGNGGAVYAPKVDYPAAVSPLGIAAAPLDNDGTIDLAIAASGSNSICTLLGNGNGTFPAMTGPVYVWNTGDGVMGDGNSWIPARSTFTANDILVFNRGTAINVNSVTTTSLGQIFISGETQVAFNGFITSPTLTVAGGTGDDAVIEEGSRLILANPGNPVSFSMASGAQAMVYGDLNIYAGASRFQALSTNGILFQSTGRATIGAGSGTTPFGNGTGGSGLNSVNFLFGSQLIAQTSFSVFGATAPNAVVKFGPGSRFRMDNAFNPDVSGRTYGDFEYNVPSGISAFVGSGGVTLDSLIMTQGTLSVETTGNVAIRGNIVLNTCTGANQIRFLPPTPTTIHLNGTSQQTFYSASGINCIGGLLRIYASSNVTWNLDNPGGLRFLTPWRTVSNFLFTKGTITDPDFWQLVPDSSSTITGAAQATGWVVTELSRRVTADGVVRLDVGDSANYLPIDVDVHGVNKPGYFTAVTSAYDPYDVGRAQLDPAHRVHRSYLLTASDLFNNYPPPTFFSTVDPTLRFLPSDMDPGSDPLQFVTRLFYWTDRPWMPSTIGTRTATSIQVLGLTPAIVDTFYAMAVGQPITPSLSVVDASAPEGNGPAAVGPVAAAKAVIAPSFETVEEGEITAPFQPWRAPLAPTSAVLPARTQDAGSLAFRVRLSQVAVVPISVDYQTVDGTATVADGDYTPASGTLNFAPGDSALDIVVPFGADTTPEHNETFGITLSNAVGATIGTPTATGTIVDDDDLIPPTAQVISPNGGEVIYQGQQVNLQWTASDNFAVNGVDIKLLNGGSVTTLASNVPNSGSYLWTASGPASIKMKFRVVAHDDNHATTDDSDANWELNAATVGVDDLPIAFALAAPSPNPSPARLQRIAFSVPRESHVRLTVHDVRGRTVAELADGTVPAGHYVRIWDSTRAGAGVYFLRFEAPGFRADDRLVVIH